MKEIWKDIAGWEDRYSISNLGRVYTKKYRRLLSIHTSNHGYSVVDLTKFYKGNMAKKTCYVHRLVAETFIPNPNKLGYVDHINQDKTDNTVTNLQWVTNSENVKKGYLQNKNYRKDKFKKCPVYVTTTPITYYKSMTDCAYALGVSVERVKTVLRFFNGNLKELGLTIVRC